MTVMGPTTSADRSASLGPGERCVAHHGPPPAVAGLVIESGIANVHELLLRRAKPDEHGVTPAQLEQAVAQDESHAPTTAAQISDSDSDFRFRFQFRFQFRF